MKNNKTDNSSTESLVKYLLGLNAGSLNPQRKSSQENAVNELKARGVPCDESGVFYFEYSVDDFNAVLEASPEKITLHGLMNMHTALDKVAEKKALLTAVVKELMKRGKEFSV